MMFQKACGLALAVALATAIPQGLPPGVENLPDCALNGLPAVLAASGCQGIDIDCLCSKPDLPAQLDGAVNRACSDEADRAQIKAFIAGFCPTSSSSTTAAPSTTESSTTESSSMPTSTEMTTTMPMTTSTTMMMPSGASSTMMNATNGTSPTYNSPSPTDTAAPISTGAASSYGVSVFAFVVAMGGMTWAFAEL